MKKEKILSEFKYNEEWMKMTYTGLPYNHNKPEEYPVPVRKKFNPASTKTLLFKWFWGF